MKIVDLSVPIGPNIPGVTFEQWTHEAGPGIISKRARRLPGDSLSRRITNYWGWLLGRRVVRQSDLPPGGFLSNEFFSMSVHTGTHIDAPFHYGPRTGVSPAKKVLDIPLEWLYAPAVVIDGTRLGPIVEAADIESELARISCDSLEGVMALVRTDSDQKFGTPAYFTDSVAISPSAIGVLLDRGARVIGTDAWSLDRPAHLMLEEYFETGDGGRLWPSHMYGREREFVTIECLTSLGDLPPKGFVVSALPIALRDAGGAWARAVAILDDD